jgi:hypothetical protein
MENRIAAESQREQLSPSDHAVLSANDLKRPLIPSLFALVAYSP